MSKAAVRIFTRGNLAALCSSFCLIGPAWGALGGDYASVESDRQAMRAQLRSTPAVQYDVHEISSASGTIVREYVSRAGKVFAITWQAPVMPDLRQLLGEYFDRYTAAAASPRPGAHRQFAVRRPDVVVESSGHLRAFRGKAYVPAALPDGVSASDLQ